MTAADDDMVHVTEILVVVASDAGRPDIVRWWPAADQDKAIAYVEEMLFVGNSALIAPQRLENVYDPEIESWVTANFPSRPPAEPAARTRKRDR